jgi:hypothetical protein
MRLRRKYSLPIRMALASNRTETFSTGRARTRFATEKSDILTDAHAYDECMRIRQEESHSTMRAFCSDVCPFHVTLSNLIYLFSHGPIRFASELHISHDDPRYQRPAQRPPLRAHVRRARPSRTTRFGSRIERACR